MISLDGNVARKFFFPTDPDTTLQYFSDLNRIIYFLPHITVDEVYDADRIRIRYQTVELGAYTINIYCDLECTVKKAERQIIISPLSGKAPVESASSLNTTTGHGTYQSQAILYAEKDGTGIDYQLQFLARLQRPRGLRMMPGRIVDRIAVSISQGRLEEMAEGFMSAALDAFPDWLAEQNGQAGRSKKRRDRVPADSC
jgi:hypothetical protein